MRKIHQLFKEPGASLFRKHTYGFERSICWYPSAGNDYRHIEFLEREWLKTTADAEPRLYLHTDVWLPNQSVNAKDSTELLPFEVGLKLSDQLTVEEVTEVTFKRPPIGKSSDVLYISDPDVHNGRCFFVLLRIEQPHRRKVISWTVPLVYVIAENLTFLVRFLLLYQVRVHTLVHIRDGGASMGNSRIPMSFIYLVTDRLRIQRVVSDLKPPGRAGFEDGARALSNAVRNFENDFSLEHRYQRPQGLFQFDNCRDLTFSHEKDIGDKIRSEWHARPIPTTEYPANWAKPPDGNYYDWSKA